MSRDHFNIVDCDATLKEAPELAEIVIAWMISEGIVVPTNSKLPGWPKHYPGGPRLGEWAASPESAGDITRQAEGVDVEIGRQVFLQHEADGWPDAICPNGPPSAAAEGRLRRGVRVVRRDRIRAPAVHDVSECVPRPGVGVRAGLRARQPGLHVLERATVEPKARGAGRAAALPTAWRPLRARCSRSAGGLQAG